jgi:hypothetical protein
MRSPMSKCELAITLDRSEHTFTLGERIEGEVAVTADEGVRCDGLTLALGWQTHGQGNRTHGEPRAETLFVGSWIAGERARHRFSIEAPRGPVTYHGHYLNVDWALLARADIPWAIDPRATAELLLVPPTEGRLEAYDHGPRHVETATGGPASPTSARAVQVVLGLLFIGFSVASFILSKGASLGAVVPLALGAYFLYRVFVRDLLVRRKVGRVDAVVRPARLRGGDHVTCTLSFAPRRAASIEGISISLVGREVVVKGSGTNKTTHKHELHRESRELGVPGGAARPDGAPLQVEAKLAVPAGAAPTFAATDNRLEWSIDVEIRIASCPDHKASYPIAVLP